MAMKQASKQACVHNNRLVCIIKVCMAKELPALSEQIDNNRRFNSISHHLACET